MTSSARIREHYIASQPQDTSTVLVIGPGWLGSAIVAASSRSGAGAWSIARGGSAGVDGGLGSGTSAHHALQGDITRAETDAGLDTLLAALPRRVDHVVLCVAPSRSRGDNHASLYPAAARGAVRLASALHARTLLYTSSTGVYGASDGAVVREDAPVAGGDERQRALLEAEDEILSGGRERAVRRIVLRVAGLYGPDRDPAPRFRMIAADGSDARWCNFAWRDDVVSAVQHLQSHAELMDQNRLFNCGDGHPVRARDVTRALLVTEAVPSPESAPASRPRSNQRVAVDRLMATGWSPRVPTVFAGLRLLGHSVDAA